MDANLCVSRRVGLWILTIDSLLRAMVGSSGETGVESNERYYRRRAVEERMAARRAVTDQAKAWHA